MGLGISTVMEGLFARITTQGSTPIILSMTGAPRPATVTAYPVSGDTVLVEQSCDDGNTFNPIPLLNATTLTNTILTSGVTHLRVTRTAGIGVTSYMTVC